MKEGRKIELLKPLGAGGFSVVYLARMRGRDGFSRRVAVKLLRRDQIENDEVLRRQRDEARLLGLLQHPNIVQVFDLTEIDGSPAVVMEYVEGTDVSSLIKGSGALPGPAALAIVSGVASALEAGWSFVPPDTGRPLHVIHRDIKPANVLVTVHGAVKVLDFGVARADFEREGHTQSVAFGTPRFMAPEQFLRGELTGANDIYALGVTAWEMLTGRGFERPSLEEGLHRRGVHFQLDALPEPYREGVARMLAHAAAQRPTAAEVMAWADSLAVPGESLRAYARRVVPGAIAARDTQLAQGTEGKAAAARTRWSAPATAAHPPAAFALSSAGLWAPPAPRSTPRAPAGGPPVHLQPPEPIADSGHSLVSEVPGRKQGTVALMAGGIAALIGLGGVAALALGAAWVSGVFNPGEPDLTEAIVDEAARPGDDPVDVGGTAATIASGDDAAPPAAAEPAEAAPPPATRSSRKSTASDPHAPVRKAPSAETTPVPGATSEDAAAATAPV
ncbi:MAG: serine/threonine protein kinase, partial [Deltaproteobacteria bacterium]|nr:serine/threonine protein kinase [Deltaproteobacteria bacterium]